MPFVLQNPNPDQESPFKIVDHLLRTLTAWLKQPTIVWYNGHDVNEVKTLDQFGEAIMREIDLYLKDNPHEQTPLFGLKVRKKSNTEYCLDVYQLFQPQAPFFTIIQTAN